MLIQIYNSCIIYMETKVWQHFPPQITKWD